MGLDWSWLLVGWSLSLGLTELLDETHWLTVETSLEAPSNSGVDNLHEVLVAHVQELVKLVASVRVLSERPRSLLVGSGLCIVVIHCAKERRGEDLVSERCPIKLKSTDGGRDFDGNNNDDDVTVWFEFGRNDEEWEAPCCSFETSRMASQVVRKPGWGSLAAASP